MLKPSEFLSAQTRKGEATPRSAKLVMGLHILMRDSTKQWIWLLVYVLILVAPVAVIMLGPRPEPREFWRELSVGLGFTGFTLVGAQFILTSRLKALSHSFSMDELYYYHRWAAFVGFILVLAHPLILLQFNPTVVQLLNPFTAPLRAVFGLIAMLALIVLISTSFLRQQLDIKYEIWRLVHASGAIVIVITAMGHILLVEHYLALPRQQVLWAGLAVVWIGIIVYNWFIKPLRRSRWPYTITEISEEVEDVWRLAIEPEGHEGIDFMPGQFAWLTVNRRPFALRENPFSMASSAEATEYLEFAIQEVGDFTSRIGEFPVGTPVYLDGPHGTFSIDKHQCNGYVFIAGGIGSPPIISMLRTMADRQDQSPAWMFYGNVEEAHIAFRDELIRLEETINLRVVHVLEEASEDWEGETGFIDADILGRHLPQQRDDFIYFLCGPLPMMDAVKAALAEIDVPLENVFVEQYEMV